MCRYLWVLIDEFAAMKRAALSRNLMGGKHWQRVVVGNMIGSLFIRTYERGERIHQAMLSRGYEGITLVQGIAKGGKKDVVALTLTAIFALLGQMVYLI